MIDKKDGGGRKKNIITIDSNSISIFFYQLYFSNYICTLTRKLIDQAMFRACGRTRTRGGATKFLKIKEKKRGGGKISETEEEDRDTLPS